MRCDVPRVGSHEDDPAEHDRQQVARVELADQAMSPWSIACHEAGHATVAWWHGWPIEFIECGDAETGGRCKVQHARQATADQLETYSVAGAVATAMLTSHADDLQTLRSDLGVQVVALIAGATGDAHSRAMAILEPRRARVWKLAHTLRRCGRMSDDDVTRLLGRTAADVEAAVAEAREMNVMAAELAELEQERPGILRRMAELEQLSAPDRILQQRRAIDIGLAERGQEFKDLATRIGRGDKLKAELAALREEAE